MGDFCKNAYPGGNICGRSRPCSAHEYPDERRMGPYRCPFCGRRVCLKCRCDCRSPERDAFLGNSAPLLNTRRVDRAPGKGKP